MATITFNRTVDTNPNNTDTFVYVYTPNESGLTTKTFTIERDVHYDVQAREAIFLGEWLAELGYDASIYSVDGNGVIYNKTDFDIDGPLIPRATTKPAETPEEI
tara:strand:- start:2356 stop:2667 length:312 start_codon:yes stop_codon:yes gene_type:complete